MRLFPRMSHCALILFAALAAPVVLAQQPDTAKKKSGALKVLTDTTKRYGLVPEHFTISVGAFLPNISSRAQLSTQNHGGTDVNLEDVLGLKSNLQSIDLQAAVRLGSRQLITLGYFGLRRSASRTLNDSIVFGDSIYHAGATIDASTKLYYYGLTYRFYFFKDPRWDLGAGLGIDAFNINASLGVRASGGGGGGSFSDSVKKSGGFTAPAPMLGLYGDWEFAPRFFFRGQLQFLYINKVESYGGGVTDDRVGIDWFPFLNYGVGLMYHYVGLRITKTFNNSDELTFKYYIQGPALYFTAAF